MDSTLKEITTVFPLDEFVFTRLGKDIRDELSEIHLARHYNIAINCISDTVETVKETYLKLINETRLVIATQGLCEPYIYSELNNEACTWLMDNEAFACGQLHFVGARYQPPVNAVPRIGQSPYKIWPANIADSLRNTMYSMLKGARRDTEDLPRYKENLRKFLGTPEEVSVHTGASTRPRTYGEVPESDRYYLNDDRDAFIDTSTDTVYIADCIEHRRDWGSASYSCDSMQRADLVIKREDLGDPEDATAIESDIEQTFEDDKWEDDSENYDYDDHQCSDSEHQEYRGNMACSHRGQISRNIAEYFENNNQGDDDE